MKLSVPPHVAFRVRELYDRVRFLFELLGAIVVGAFVGALLLAGPTRARAAVSMTGWNGPAFYFTAGIGESRLQRPHENKWWVQEGWDYASDEKATSFRLGLGVTLSRYLAIETNYHDLGTYSHFAGFMLNENIYNVDAPNYCLGPCDPTTWGYLTGKAKAWSITALPRYPFTRDFSVFGRIGAAYYSAKFDVYLTPSDPHSRSWAHSNTLSQNGWTMARGVGLTYKALSIEATQFPGVKANNHGCCSAYQSATSYTVSYRWDFQ